MTIDDGFFGVFRVWGITMEIVTSISAFSVKSLKLIPLWTLILRSNVTFSVDVLYVKVGLGINDYEISSYCISQNLLFNFVMEFRVVVFQGKLGQLYEMLSTVYYGQQSRVFLMHYKDAYRSWEVDIIWLSW